MEPLIVTLPGRLAQLTVEVASGQRFSARTWRMVKEVKNMKKKLTDIPMA
jgi:hypothetical protein